MNLKYLFCSLNPVFLEITENPSTKVPLCAPSMESLLTVKDKDNPITMVDKTGLDMKTINGGIKNDGSSFGNNDGFSGFGF